MAYIWDKMASALSAHPTPPPAPSPPAMTVGEAVAGLVALEKLAFAARQSLAFRNLQGDEPLPSYAIKAVAPYVPPETDLRAAGRIASTLISALVARK